LRGNCYVTSEALYHLMGGKDMGWKPMRMRHEGDTHRFLINTITGQILDATASQFKNPPNWRKAVGAGFLTKAPSKRAKSLMKQLVWQGE
jgi:hypothetical protein